MKLPTKDQIKKDLPMIYLPLFICALLVLLWNAYGNETTAKIEASLGKTIFTDKENDCRIDNLKYLSKESHGNGKVYLLKLYDSKISVPHLVICNEKNQVIDRNNQLITTICDFDKFEINLTALPKRVKYKKLAELVVYKNNVEKTILYNNSYDQDYALTLNGIEYTNVFLKSLKR